MHGLALFRMPFATACTRIEGEVAEVGSMAACDGCQGYVMAPFAADGTHPSVLIRADRQTTYAAASEVPASAIAAVEPLGCVTPSSPETCRNDYHAAFAHFHSRLLSGEFQKLVLSRSFCVGRTASLSPLDLFRRACDRYPRLFIALVYTPQTGLWLVSTPEVLLRGNGLEWQTMALAGTMPYAPQVSWGDKDIREQRYVATYITRQLQPFAQSLQEEGPYTARAGHLTHLRSDFRFTLRHGASLDSLLQALHPTPAVCGLPKEEAFRLICQQEHHERSYYSGFMGPLHIGGQTSLFVTLRCMQVFDNGYRLYSGGGLLKDSVEEREWQETEIKLDTMRHLLSDR